MCVESCQPADIEAMYATINNAAQAYRGGIPADRWHEPYMPREELAGRQHGFRRGTPAEKDRLLWKYWAIPERQVETSVVLECRDRMHES